MREKRALAHEQKRNLPPVLRSFPPLHHEEQGVSGPRTWQRRGNVAISYATYSGTWAPIRFLWGPGGARFSRAT